MTILSSHDCHVTTAPPPPRREGPLPVEEVVKAYIRTAVDTDNYYANTKYCLAQIMHNDMDTPEGQALLAANSMREIW